MELTAGLLLIADCACICARQWRAHQADRDTSFFVCLGSLLCSRRKIHTILHLVAYATLSEHIRGRELARHADQPSWLKVVESFLQSAIFACATSHVLLGFMLSTLMCHSARAAAYPMPRGNARLINFLSFAGVRAESLPRKKLAAIKATPLQTCALAFLFLLRSLLQPYGRTAGTCLFYWIMVDEHT